MKAKFQYSISENFPSVVLLPETEEEEMLLGIFTRGDKTLTNVLRINGSVYDCDKSQKTSCHIEWTSLENLKAFKSKKNG